VSWPNGLKSAGPIQEEDVDGTAKAVPFQGVTETSLSASAEMLEADALDERNCEVYG